MSVLSRASCSGRKFLCVGGVWVRSGYQRAVVLWLDTGQELAISVVYPKGYLNNLSTCWFWMV